MPERPTLLVIDDDQSARDTVEALLFADRYALELASNGREAVARLEGPEVDLVVCDVMMPGVDGFEVCRQIKAHPRWRFVPVILATALDGQDDLVRGIEAGADEFLSKPIDKIVLRAKVRAMLRVRRLYGQLRAGVTDLDQLHRDRRDQLAAQAGLSTREREVLELLLLGRSHEDIGVVLGIAARTAKFHQMNLLRKLGAESRLDLLRIFV